MIYKLYIETIKQDGKLAWSYAFYNHQDFMVYKRFGTTEEADVNKLILEISAIALKYFEGSIRRRYYDEHFSTRIDEDYVTLYTHHSEIPKIAQAYKSENASSLVFADEEKELWEALFPFFAQRTMIFEDSLDEKFIDLGIELAKKAL